MSRIPAKCEHPSDDRSALVLCAFRNNTTEEYAFSMVIFFALQVTTDTDPFFFLVNTRIVEHMVSANCWNVIYKYSQGLIFLLGLCLVFSKELVLDLYWLLNVYVATVEETVYWSIGHRWKHLNVSYGGIFIRGFRFFQHFLFCFHFQRLLFLKEWGRLVEVCLRPL